MNRALEVAAALRRQAYEFWSGVPCSYLKDLFAAFAEHGDAYFPALREDSACAMGAGAFLGGKAPAIAMQNSGFGIATNAIASLLIPCRVPAILIVSWRGKSADSPEHDVMGSAFPTIVSALGLAMVEMTRERPGLAIDQAASMAAASALPVVVAVEKAIL